MPSYAFTCRDCGNDFEELVPRLGDTAPCPACKSTNVEQRIAAPPARVGQSLQEKRGKSSGCGSGPSTG